MVHSPVRLIGKEGQKPEAFKMANYRPTTFFNDCCEAATRLGDALPRTRASVRSALVHLDCATSPRPRATQFAANVSFARFRPPVTQAAILSLNSMLIRLHRLTSAGGRMFWDAPDTDREGSFTVTRGSVDVEPDGKIAVYLGPTL